MANYATKKDIQEIVDANTLKMFKYLDKRFGEIDGRLEETDAKIDRYASAVDAYAKQTETYMQEMLALAHKVDRLERWIMQIADKTGVRLTPPPRLLNIMVRHGVTRSDLANSNSIMLPPLHSLHKVSDRTCSVGLPPIKQAVKQRPVSKDGTWKRRPIAAGLC